ncbi:MAG: DnaJ domain-containing protein [Bradyrhizobium sp.]|nr:DnaJ domain-containing protein [Bradyrhizobium sp.]
METLYDLLGALPRDDAEELRAAFRRAVKGAHPDLNPGDPDAGQKFREIVRANEILTDEDQRAAYDHLLDLAHKEQNREAGAKVMHKVATSVIALIVTAGLSGGGYLMFLREPALADTLKRFAEVATARPADFARLQLPAAARPQPIAMAAARAGATTDAAPPQDAAAPAAKQEMAANVASEVMVPIAVATVPITPEPESTTATIGPPLAIMPPDARTFRERGISAYRTGDLDQAMADLDRAIQLDPKFSAAYVDRGILLYRLQKFERAFADIAQAKRIEKAKNVRSAKDGGKDVAKKQRPPQTTMVLGLPPLSQRHTTKLE